MSSQHVKRDKQNYYKYILSSNKLLLKKTYTLHTYQLAACFNKLEAVVFTTLAAHTDPHSTPHQNTNDVTLWIRGRHRRKTTEQHAGGDGGG